MDLVYAHGQVEGTLSDGAQGVGANPTWGVVPGSTARTAFYRDDLLRYHGRQNRGHRVANLLRGTVAPPAQPQVALPPGATHDASSRAGFAYQLQPAYATDGWTLHWTPPDAAGRMRLSVFARKSAGWLAVGFTDGSQGTAAGRKCRLTAAQAPPRCLPRAQAAPTDPRAPPQQRKGSRRPRQLTPGPGRSKRRGCPPFQPAGMVGSTALVGFAEGSVGLYALTAKAVSGVVPLPPERALISGAGAPGGRRMLDVDGPSVQVVDGTMVLEATVNASTLGVSTESPALLLWAHGPTSELSYHGANRRAPLAASDPSRLPDPSPRAPRRAPDASGRPLSSRQARPFLDVRERRSPRRGGRARPRAARQRGLRRSW